MSEQIWKTKGSRVYGDGQSYNCINVVTAERLCNTLNKYYTTHEIINQTSEHYEKLNKQLVQINMTLGILTEELHTLNQMVKQ